MIPQIVSWLRNESGYEESYVYETMMKRNYTRFLREDILDFQLEELHSTTVDPPPKLQETYARSYALRMLIHYLGDVHQPLHCFARIDN